MARFKYDIEGIGVVEIEAENEDAAVRQLQQMSDTELDKLRIAPSTVRTVTQEDASSFRQEFAPGMMELRGLQAGGSMVNRLFGGGRPGVPAPSPEIAPPGMRLALEASPGIQRAALATGGGLLAAPLAAGTGMPLLAAEALTAAGSEGLAQIATGTGGLLDIILAGGSPIGMRAVFRGGRDLLRVGAKNIPGAGATLQEDAVARGRALIQRLRPVDLDSLRIAAQAMDDVQVPLRNLQEVAMDLQIRAENLAPALRPTTAMRIVQQVDAMVEATTSKALPLRQVRDNLEEIGAEIGRLRRAAGDRSGLVRGVSRNLNALRKVYRAILDDLDALPGEAPAALQQLRKTLRTNFAVNDLELIIEKGIDQRAIDGLTFLRPRQIRQAWQRGRDSQFLRESFSAAEHAEIDRFMDELLELPALPTPQGVAAGSMHILTRTAGAGGIIGGIAGPEAGAVAAGVAAIAPRVVAKAMMTARGRDLLRSMLSRRPILTPQSIELLAAATRQAAFPPQPGGFQGAPESQRFQGRRRAQQELAR